MIFLKIFGSVDYLPYIFLALLEGCLTASVLALSAVGLSLVFGVLRIVNIAHGEFFMLGAVLAWAVADWLGGFGGAAVGFSAALLLAPLASAGIAALADGLVLKRLKYQVEATIVATIGLLYVLRHSTLSLYGAEARPVSPPFEALVLFPWFGYSTYKLFVMGAAVMILLGVSLLLHKSQLGLVLRATRYDPETAQNFGIPTARVYSCVFALGAGLAALGGVLIVPIRQAHYLMGAEPLLLSFMVVIIGGLGSWRGTILAALLIGLSDGLVSVLFSPTLAKIIAGLLVVAILICRPQGLFGEKIDSKI